MVSLRSGSTTDNKDICGPAEVSSKRSRRRIAARKDSRLVKEADSNKKDPAADVTPAAGKNTRTKQKLLATIAETPRPEASNGEGT